MERISWTYVVLPECGCLTARSAGKVRAWSPFVQVNADIDASTENPLLKASRFVVDQARSRRPVTVE